MASPRLKQWFSFRDPSQIPVRTFARLLCSLPLLLAACRGRKAAEAPTPSEPVARPLAQLAALRVIVTPAHSLRPGDALGWAAHLPRSREYLKSLDSALTAALSDRGLQTQWIYPADLVRAQRGSPTYAADPYSLAANPLRNADVKSGAKLGDPLVTQLRTMIALQEARMVLIPVELRFEKDSAGQGLAVLHVAMIDARLGEVRWTGDVRSDPGSTLTPAVLSSLAAHFADLIAAP